MVDEYTVNKNIARFIKESDKRPSAVADRAGIRRDTFSRIIHCKRPIYAHEIMPISIAIGLSIEEMFREN